MSSTGVTLDTGALIAMERGKARGAALLTLGRRREVDLAAPTAVITEWWRGRSDVRDEILDVVRVEPLSLLVAKVAGEAIAAIEGATAVDAIVMAFAALRGDLVYTSELDDLERLRRHFPTVRLLAI